MRAVLKLGVVLSMMFIAAGCGSPPQAELDSAQAALDAAKQAQADVYAPDAYTRAKNSLADARAKVEQSDYEAAKTSAVQAKEQAEQALSLAGTNKQQMMVEAQNIANRVSTGLGDARTALDGAPRGKGADDDLDQLRADLGQAEASLSGARNSLNGGNAKSALEQAKSADNKLSSVQSAVQVAMKKIDDWKTSNKVWYEL
jgi:hypothetical protein